MNQTPSRSRRVFAIDSRFLIFSIFILLTCLAQQSVAQKLPKYDLGGASKPSPMMNFKGPDQYKRIHQTSLRLILRGEIEPVQNYLENHLAQNPTDPETMYMLGILHGQKGDVPLAESYLRKSIEAGLPEGRLIAGPREVSKPMQNTKLMNELLAKPANALVHGPLLGNVTGTSASFWVRTAKESDVYVVVEDSSRKLKVQSPTARSRSSEDFTALVSIERLQPQTEYQYKVFIDGNLVEGTSYSFRTFAEQGTHSKFSLAFGGGAGYVPENERMWDTIGAHDPNAILLLGDNVYIDDPESVAMQQYTYQRRQSRPEWRRLTARSPVFTIWDDHDFSTNDSWGGSDVNKPFWKKDWVFPIFRQNWVNPGYGGGDELPGCWYSFSIGDVEFIMLDCRYYRTDPKADSPSMLGAPQKAWLKKKLTESKGTFKVLCSSVPWDFRTKGDSLDTWNGFKEEFEEIIGFIDTENIEGVLLLSADRHRSDCWKIERPNGYGLYEFNSSRLTNQHVHPRMEKAGAIFSFNQQQSFGLVTFDTTASDPTVTYTVVDIDGKQPHTITVKRSQLKK